MNVGTDLFERCGEGLRLQVRLTPKASRDAVRGIVVNPDGRPVLRASVTAVPEDGKANIALLALLAKQWKLPRSALSITSGASSRNKTLVISGNPEALLSSLSGKIPS